VIRRFLPFSLSVTPFVDRPCGDAGENQSEHHSLKEQKEQKEKKSKNKTN